MISINNQDLVTFRNLPDVIISYFQNIPEESLDVRRNSEAWTIREHIYHVAGIQEMLLGRINTIITDKRPVIKPYFPENDDNLLSGYSSMDEAYNDYQTIRDKQCSIIESANPEIFKKEAEHDEYTKYSLPILIKHMIFHEYWHMYRVEEIWLIKDEYFK